MLLSTAHTQDAKLHAPLKLSASIVTRTLALTDKSRIFASLKKRKGKKESKLHLPTASSKNFSVPTVRAKTVKEEARLENVGLTWKVVEKGGGVPVEGWQQQLHLSPALSNTAEAATTMNMVFASLHLYLSFSGPAKSSGQVGCSRGNHLCAMEWLGFFGMELSPHYRGVLGRSEGARARWFICFSEIVAVICADSLFPLRLHVSGDSGFEVEYENCSH